ncbi:MAG TPA: DUF1565 domain-containing protein [Coleofasciculaceae cyanobacterium]
MRLLPSPTSLLCCPSRSAIAIRIGGLGLALLTALLPCSGQAIAQAVSAPAASSSAAPAAQRLLYVNPATGNDQGNGSEALPFQTITRALQVATPQTIILLAAGTYSPATGESFPLVMKPDVTIQGDPTVLGQGFVIQGGGLFLSPTSAGQNIAILGANRAVLVGVTLTNPDPRGYGLWVESSDPVVLSNTFTGNGHDGISTVGTSAPLIQGNRFVQNGANGITIFGRSRPQVRENAFENTGFGINISEYAAPLILQNRISRNRIGIVVQRSAQPVIRGNLIEGSREDGIAAVAQALPNLGTVAEPGNNVFQNNARYNINATADNQIISAFGNQGLGDRLTGQIDTAGTLPSAIIASASEQIPVNAPTSFNPVLINQLPPTVSSNLSSSNLSTSNSSSNSSSSLLAPAAPLAATATSVSTAAAIDLPVPPPAASPALASSNSSPRPLPVVSSAAPGQSQTVALTSATAAATAAAATIPIPVPPPERRPVRSTQSSLPTANLPATPTLQADLLPVPDGNVPVGNIGDLPTVNVFNNPLRNGDTASNSATASLRYRVVVEANGDRTQALVKSIAPNAFLTEDRGRSLMQVGAFSNRDNAEAAVQMLNQNGLRATIEDMK